MKSKQIKTRNRYQESINNKIVEVKEYNELQEDAGKLYPTVVPYSTSIPFQNACSVVYHTLLTSDTWTPNTYDPLIGGGAIYRIIGDGSHSPTFTGFYLSGSGAYDATLNAVNLITFLYDGISYWYTITQPAT